MTTVALFGGSFNPPHLAHQMVCFYVLATQEVDRLWLVPTFRHPFAKELASFADRYRMCELASESLGDRTEVSRIEEELGSPSSRTLETLLALKQRHPTTTFRLVIGADILAERQMWFRWDEVERLAPPIVVGRSGYPSSCELDLPAISSTQVRERLGAGRSVGDWVSRSVLDYIETSGLYREQSAEKEGDR